MSQPRVADPHFLGVNVDLSQQSIHGQLLISGQVLLGQPAAALDAEQVSGGAARDQVAMQDGLHLVLQAGALTHDVRPPRDLPTQRLGGLISDPHRRQIISGQQLGEDSTVLVVSDGRQNIGSNPEEPAQFLASRGARVFTLTVGSHQTAHDAAVDHIDAPDWVYAEDDVVVSPVIRLDGLRDRDITVEFRRDKKVLDTRKIKARADQEARAQADAATKAKAADEARAAAIKADLDNTRALAAMIPHARYAELPGEDHVGSFKLPS